MVKCLLLISIFINMSLFPISAFSENRIVYIDSYHKGYGWSDGILQEIQSIMNESDVGLEVFHMDTKRNTDEGFKKKAALNAKTKIPTGCDLDFMTPYSFLGYTRSAQEQGRWAAQAALKIIGGTPASDIPMSKNVEGDMTVNLKVAKAAGIKVPKSLLKKAVHIIE